MKIIFLIQIFMLTLLLVLSGCSKVESRDYDTFASCLTESGAKMFGAYWCPHCQSQKEMFGESWNLIEYIECSLPNRAGQTAVCGKAGIKSYPTWEFTDGTRKSGTLSLEDLSFLSGCAFG